MACSNYAADIARTNYAADIVRRNYAGWIDVAFNTCPTAQLSAEPIFVILRLSSFASPERGGVTRSVTEGCGGHRPHDYAG